MMKKLAVLISIMALIFLFACGQNENSASEQTVAVKDAQTQTGGCGSCSKADECGSAQSDCGDEMAAQNNNKAEITFIELGSVNCVPCKQMQPVMKSIEEKYGEKVAVVFYDIWKPEQKQFAQKYNIKLIPTQVFLDKSGKEIYRHEGFLPVEEIETLLKNNGISPAI